MLSLNNLIEKSLSGKNIRLGIMGGTFDPIHMGHLVTAEEARQEFKLDNVVFVPAGYPPHKEQTEVSKPEHRYLMTVLATITNPYFTVSRVEIDMKQDQPIYTVETVKRFRQMFGQKVELYFITGADAILDIITWKDYHDLLDICYFIAATRPGYPFDRVEKHVKPYYPEIMEKLSLLEIPAMAISSTRIRERVRKNRTIKYLTPEAVEQYILKNNLYSNS